MALRPAQAAEDSPHLVFEELVQKRVLNFSRIASAELLCFSFALIARCRCMRCAEGKDRELCNLAPIPLRCRR